MNVVKINSRKNKEVIHARKLGKDNQYRDEYGEFLCDGKKLLIEAINSGARITRVFTLLPPEFTLPGDIKIYHINKDLISYISPLKNPQDTLFTCKIPERNERYLTKGVHILLDNVQDPGNIGTIIRSADAFSIDSILLTRKCADLYNPKTIRASMGAIFRQKIFYADINFVSNTGLKFIGTANNTEYTKLCEADLNNCIIIMGNEGQGISDELLPFCKEMITIPQASGCESLNVAIAASIIMYQARMKISSY